MTEENGGGSRSAQEKLAPVIPLFGGVAATPADEPSATADAASQASPRVKGISLVEPSRDDRVVHLRGTESLSEPDAGSPSERHPARGRAGTNSVAPRLRALRDSSGSSDDEDEAVDPDRQQEVASESLVRKLRARSLSISEARLVLRGHHLESGRIDDVIDEFTRRGYLDDMTLAENLVESGSQRKGQGRVALSRALSQRGIPREIVDAVLGELPDDDADRALEFARTKARSMSRLDPDTALRRLMGQLARRGYGGSVAMTAAKTALREATFGGPTTGVRFVDSD